MKIEPKKTLKRSKMFIIYMTRMTFRIMIFLFVVYLYFARREILEEITEYRFFSHFTPLHVLWVILMIGMLIHIFPVRITMSGFKSRRVSYNEPPGGYDRLELLEYIQAVNVRAWRLALVWFSFNSIFGILLLLGLIGSPELILLSFFYFTCDLICMMLFCPFQRYIMGNRCCVTCRIFDWGHLMMYTPMLYIRSFFSWSLFFTALFVMLRWEIVYARHPERFYRGSNTTIRCENCEDKICHIKRPLVDSIDSVARRIPLAEKTIGRSAGDLDKN